jgi:hypothetical protein
VGVAAEVEVLHREGGRLVLANQVAHPRVDVGQPPLERNARTRLDDTAVERGKPAPMREHDAIPGIGRARVYAEDDH